MLAQLQPTALQPLLPLGMLSAKLGPLPWLAMVCPLDTPQMQAQVGGLLRLPTTPTIADTCPRSHGGMTRQPLKQARLVWGTVCQVGRLRQLPLIPPQSLQPAVAHQAAADALM